LHFTIKMTIIIMG